MRVLFDTNVLASAFTSHGLCHQAYERAMICAETVTAPRLLAELRRSLVTKMKIEAGLADEICAELQNELEVIEPTPLPKTVCRDEDDDWVLATALAGNADFIITGDRDLLVLKEFQGIKILTPRQFVVMLDRQK